MLDASGNLKTSASTETCFGGSARRKQYISEFKAANPNTIVLDGGSAFWGSFMCTHINALMHAMLTPSHVSSCLCKVFLPLFHFLHLSFFLTLAFKIVSYVRRFSLEPIYDICRQIVNSERFIWPR